MNKEFILEVVSNIIHNNLFELYDEVKYTIEYDIKSELEMHYNGVTVESNSNDGVYVDFLIKHENKEVKIGFYGHVYDVE